MSYLEVIRRNGRTYYYATKNFRVASSRWRKARAFLGDRKPGRERLKEAYAELEKRAVEMGYRPPPLTPFRYLDETEAEKLEDVRDAYKKWYGKLGPDEREKYQSDFLVRFTYNTNAIEGNRLSLRETAMILNEGLIPSGTETNDYTEALNSRDAVAAMAAHRRGLSQRFLFRLHREVTKNTRCQKVGAYRDTGVRISGSDWVPPSARELPGLMKKLFVWYRNHRSSFHPVELGALLHARLVQHHPFTDGNGRVARLVMNWVLLRGGYPTFYIENRDKLNYYKALEEADRGNPGAFVKYVAARIVEQFTFHPEG